jgi:hypothetical protein
MKAESNWEEVFPDIYEQRPVLLTEKAMRVFPFYSQSIGKNVFLANLLCNFAGYYFDSLLYIHHPAGKNQEIKNHIVDFAIFLKREKLQKKIGIWYNDPFFDRENAEILIEKLRRLPAPPDSIHPCLKTIYCFLEKITNLIECPDADFALKLYELSISWSRKQTEPAMQLASARNVLKCAEFQIKRGDQKQNNHQYLFYDWGKEYHQYFQDCRDSGMCEKTARRYARQEFTRKYAHEAENLTGAYPGLSMNSLRKYQKIYLTWNQEHERL